MATRAITFTAHGRSIMASLHFWTSNGFDLSLNANHHAVQHQFRFEKSAFYTFHFQGTSWKPSFDPFLENPCFTYLACFFTHVFCICFLVISRFFPFSGLCTILQLLSTIVKKKYFWHVLHPAQSRRVCNLVRYKRWRPAATKARPSQLRLLEWKTAKKILFPGGLSPLLDMSCTIIACHDIPEPSYMSKIQSKAA